MQPGEWMTTELQKIQRQLKQMYSPEEYNKTIKNLQERAGNDIETLAHMASDHMLGTETRQFALAALSEL